MKVRSRCCRGRTDIVNARYLALHLQYPNTQAFMQELAGYLKCDVDQNDCCLIKGEHSQRVLEATVDIMRHI